MASPVPLSLIPSSVDLVTYLFASRGETMPHLVSGLIYSSKHLDWLHSYLIARILKPRHSS